MTVSDLTFDKTSRMWLLPPSTDRTRWIYPANGTTTHDTEPLLELLHHNRRRKTAAFSYTPMDDADCYRTTEVAATVLVVTTQPDGTVHMATPAGTPVGTVWPGIYELINCFYETAPDATLGARAWIRAPNYSDADIVASLA